jgi:hypothetical protein
MPSLAGQRSTLVCEARYTSKRMRQGNYDLRLHRLGVLLLYCVLGGSLEKALVAEEGRGFSACVRPSLCAARVSPWTQTIIFRHGGAVSRIPEDVNGASHRDDAYIAYPIACWEDAGTRAGTSPGSEEFQRRCALTRPGACT